jgi:hypothetical protein
MPFWVFWLFLWYWGWNLGHLVCQAHILLLSYIPSYSASHLLDIFLCLGTSHKLSQWVLMITQGESSLIIPILQMWKLRIREVPCHSQGLIYYKWYKWEFETRTLYFKSSTLRIKNKVWMKKEKQRLPRLWSLGADLERERPERPVVHISTFF